MSPCSENEHENCDEKNCNKTHYIESENKTDRSEIICKIKKRRNNKSTKEKGGNKTKCKKKEHVDSLIDEQNKILARESETSNVQMIMIQENDIIERFNSKDKKKGDITTSRKQNEEKREESVAKQIRESSHQRIMNDQRITEKAGRELLCKGKKKQKLVHRKKILVLFLGKKNRKKREKVYFRKLTRQKNLKKGEAMRHLTNSSMNKIQKINFTKDISVMKCLKTSDFHQLQALKIKDMNYNRSYIFQEVNKSCGINCDHFYAYEKEAKAERSMMSKLSCLFSFPLQISTFSLPLSPIPQASLSQAASSSLSVSNSLLSACPSAQLDECSSLPLYSSSSTSFSVNSCMISTKSISLKRQSLFPISSKVSFLISEPRRLEIPNTSFVADISLPPPPASQSTMFLSTVPRVTLSKPSSENESIAEASSLPPPSPLPHAHIEKSLSSPLLLPPPSFPMLYPNIPIKQAQNTPQVVNSSPSHQELAGIPIVLFSSSPSLPHNPTTSQMCMQHMSNVQSLPSSESLLTIQPESLPTPVPRPSTDIPSAKENISQGSFPQPSKIKNEETNNVIFPEFYVPFSSPSFQSSVGSHSVLSSIPSSASALHQKMKLDDSRENGLQQNSDNYNFALNEYVKRTSNRHVIHYSDDKNKNLPTQNDHCYYRYLFMKRKNIRYTFFSQLPIVLFFTTLTALISGYDLCIISTILRPLSKNFDLCHPLIVCASKSLFVAIFSPGALIGNIFGNLLTKHMGNKYCLAMGNIFLIAASVFLGLGEQYWLLIWGRFISGVGHGFVFIFYSTYMNEIAPPDSRGAFVGLQEVVRGLENAWRSFLGGIGGFAFIQLIGQYFVLPESPRYLVKKGEIEKAKQSMEKLGIFAQEDREIFIIRIKYETISEEWSTVSCKEKIRVVRQNYISFLLAVGCAVAYNFTGANTLVYYCIDVFRFAGICGEAFAGVGVGIFNLAGILSCIFLGKRFGRRQLLIGGTFGILCSLLALSVGFYFLEAKEEFILSDRSTCIAVDMPSSTAVASYLVLLFFLLYIYFWSLSWFGLTFISANQMLPSKVRGFGMDLTYSIHWILAVAFQMSIPALFKRVDLGGTFVLLMSLSLVTLGFSTLCSREEEYKHFENSFSYQQDFKKIYKNCNEKGAESEHGKKIDLSRESDVHKSSIEDILRKNINHANLIEENICEVASERQNKDVNSNGKRNTHEITNEPRNMILDDQHSINNRHANSRNVFENYNEIEAVDN